MQQQARCAPCTALQHVVTRLAQATAIAVWDAINNEPAEHEDRSKRFKTLLSLSAVALGVDLGCWKAVLHLHHTAVTIS